MNDPFSGEVVAENLEGSYPQPGYYTIDLTQPVSVQKGDTFAVVVKETCEGRPTTFYVDRDINGGVFISDNTFSAGQSFVSEDGASWIDLSADGDSNLRIKVFSDIVEKESFIGTPGFGQDEYTITINAPPDVGCGYGRRIRK